MYIYLEQEILPSWDSHIRNVCHLVNGIVDKINAVHPDWATNAMDCQMSH